MALTRWDPYNKHVQRGMENGRFMSGIYTRISAGPPRLGMISQALIGASGGSAASGAVVYPMGIIQNMNVGHNRQFQRLFEMGSERSYWLTGRTMGQASLSRPMYHGPSLLRILYAYYQDLIPPTVITSLLPSAALQARHDVILPPGFENMFLNLASDMFTQPTGLMFELCDSDRNTMGTFYMENTVVPNHNLSIDGGMGGMISESLSLQFERMIPVATTAVGLLGTLTNQLVN